eukprot:3315837-Karenia_brevis.AAC.1
MHHQHSLSSSSSVELDGRRRRRLGKQKMQSKLHQQKQIIQELETQCGLLSDLLGQQFTAGHAPPAKLDAPASTPSTNMAAGHASPELFDLFSTDDGHFATADHPSPVLVDTGTQTDHDQLQRSHLAKPVDVAVQVRDEDAALLNHASPVLFDAIAQTDISIHKSLPNKFYFVDEAGHASPVPVDGDFAAGVDLISFNAAISACEKDFAATVGVTTASHTTP